MKTNKQRKKFSLVLAFTLLLGLLAGCSPGEGGSAKESGAQDSKLIKVGVCAGPYEDMFRDAIEPALKEKGYQVEYVPFSDYVQPNQALAAGEIDVNLFQHSLYLKNFSKQHSLDLTAVTEVPTAGMGIFSNSSQSVNEIADGAKVAVPNDETNLTRAIRVLEQAGLVQIDPSVNSSEATQYTLSQNPKNLSFVEIEAPQLPRSLESVDLAVVNGNYALGAGLNLSDALFNEVLQDGYVNVIAVRTEDQNAAFAKDIVSIVHSDVFRNVIDDASGPYASFFKPQDYNN